MKTPLAPCLKHFFSTYLHKQRNLSPHTLQSYRDAFKLLLTFILSKRRRQKTISVQDLDVKTLLAFFHHLEDKQQGRGNSPRTRNQRLAALQSFFKYLALHHPPLETYAKRVFAIPPKRALPHSPEHLSRIELEALLSQISFSTSDGLRDLAILTFLYNTGARAQEAADARASWFDFPNRSVSILGKGEKIRVTPLWPSTVHLLQLYFRRHRRKPSPGVSDSFFINQRGSPFTRFGIRLIVKKYLERASRRCPSLKSRRLSTHSLRHTTAVHLLESRVDPNVIKAWLGHASIRSTDQYLDTDLHHKRAILQQFAPPNYVVSSIEPQPQASAGKLLDWLKDL